ncbi:MAG: pyridoxal-phosphate dependent enzyme [Bacteroidetes bacterium]|nr:pyridoxal-phosphate dependent enzyme [Bacteroidota bacterium]
MKTISESMGMVLNPPSLSDCTDWAPKNSCTSLQLLRLDAIHPIVSGNKLFKLFYNIEEAIRQKKSQVLSFGGGHSNHLAALAAAAKMYRLQSVGLIRGYYPDTELTKTLLNCQAMGMELHFLTKAEYSKVAYAPSSRLAAQFPNALLLPEGGANEAGIKGAALIAQYIPEATSHVCVAVGTGTTLAGLQRSLPSSIKLIGFCAARQCDLAKSQVENDPNTAIPEILPMLLPQFGKWDEHQLRFMQDFYKKTGIKTDVVYTGKMMQKVAKMLADGYFPRQSRILCIHTGGLQGNPEDLF